MTKEELIQYSDLKTEIEKLKRRIEQIKKQSETISDVVQNGYKSRAIISGYDYYRKRKLDKLESILKERCDKAMQLQMDIEKYINTIPESNIRQIFEHRYIDNMNWIQIMHEMEYKAESTARMKHDKYLEENL